MKIFFIPVIVFLFITMTACNNSNKKNTTDNNGKTGIPKTPVASLIRDVMTEHHAGMGNMGKLYTMQKDVQHVFDSIANLPAKSKTFVDTYVAKMYSVLEDLKSARSGMGKWMDGFNMDSLENNVEQRIKYLSREKQKISLVKENILNSLNKADSMLKEKF